MPAIVIYNNKNLMITTMTVTVLQATLSVFWTIIYNSYATA